MHYHIVLQIQESYQIMELPEQTNLVKKKKTTERQSELQTDLVKYKDNKRKRGIKCRLK